MTQRALVIAALADGPVRIQGALKCDDSQHLSELLQRLGVQVEWRRQSVQVTPAPLCAPTQGSLYCGNAGTAMRFGSCLALVSDGELTVDGDERMRQRPIGPLGCALERLGVTVRYPMRQGYPPIVLRRVAEAPPEARVDATLSSQFASGLLLVAPRMPRGLRLQLEGTVVSKPYIHMTVSMMQRQGAAVQWRDDAIVNVAPGPYRGGSDPAAAQIDIEPDWSAAAFVLSAARIAGCELTIPHLPTAGDSLQGDARFMSFLDELLRPRPHEFDLSHAPDLIAPLTAVALFADHPSRIRGAEHTRIKESDRILVLCRELRKAGAQLEEHPDGLTVLPLQHLRDAPTVELDPASDHRMAMAFGVVSLKLPMVQVRDRGCVTKSFPDFWEVLEQIRSHGTVGAVDG